MSSAETSATNRCPVCQARFRGVRECSRCGANLEPLMLLVVQAWRLRESAREALNTGEFERAFTLAQEAQTVQATPIGDFLRALSGWLHSGDHVKLDG